MIIKKVSHNGDFFPFKLCVPYSGSAALLCDLTPENVYPRTKHNSGEYASLDTKFAAGKE